MTRSRKSLAATAMFGLAAGAAAAVIAIALQRTGVFAPPPWKGNGAPIVVSGQAQIGGPFTLVDQSGAVLSEQSLHGKPTVVVFADISDAGLAEAAVSSVMETFRKSGTSTPRARVLCVALNGDPGNLAELQNFAEKWTPPPIVATGTISQLTAIARVFKFSFSSQNEPNSTRKINHASMLYVLDERGNYISHTRLPASLDTVKNLLLRALP